MSDGRQGTELKAYPKVRQGPVMQHTAAQNIADDSRICWGFNSYGGLRKHDLCRDPSSPLQRYSLFEDRNLPETVLLVPGMLP